MQDDSDRPFRTSVPLEQAPRRDGPWAIGLVLFVAGLYVLSSLVWRIEITGLGILMKRRF